MNEPITDATIERLKNDETLTSFVTPEKQKQIHANVQRLFNASGMSIQRLSDVTYISESTLTRYFSGKTKDPHFYTLCTIILALGGDVNEVLGLTPKDPSAQPPENPYAVLLDAYRSGLNSLSASVEGLSVAFVESAARHRRQRKWMIVALVALSVILLGFLTVEIVDLSVHDWGRYRWIVSHIGGN